MKNNIYRMVSLVGFLILSACGGSGGGLSSGGSSPPSPIPAPIDGGGSNGGNEYYYFDKATPREISMLTALPTSSIGLTNQFFIQITNAQAGNMRLGVFAPKCLVGANTNSYAMVLISGDGPSLVSLRTLSSTIEIEELSYDNNLTQKNGEGVQTLAGDCNDGIFLSDDTQQLSWRMIILR